MGCVDSRCDDVDDDDVDEDDDDNDGAGAHVMTDGLNWWCLTTPKIPMKKEKKTIWSVSTEKRCIFCKVNTTSWEWDGVKWHISAAIHVWGKRKFWNL